MPNSHSDLGFFICPASIATTTFTFVGQLYEMTGRWEAAYYFVAGTSIIAASLTGVFSVVQHVKNKPIENAPIGTIEAKH